MEPPRSRAPPSPSLPASFPRALLTCRPRVTTSVDEARVAAVAGADGARSAPSLPWIEPVWPPSPS
ncbi:hypothetical protein BDA96_09G198600 [Sorghum bicolor]|uniref:Uncharacterized protein n=1 Tax=Sorghum bicolor TaxID=4558 RepID=A0A921U5C4_SORBI|nr:hypothetical protein BDA96_09G198600 [Sorghum bicolor]